jgi:hypothetical protein
MTYNKYNQTVVSIHGGFLTCQKPGMDRKLQNVVYIIIGKKIDVKKKGGGQHRVLSTRTCG